MTTSVLRLPAVAAGRATLNASTRSGSDSTRNAPRYRRALIGRSSEPRRARRRAGVRTIAMAGLSWQSGHT